MLVTPPDNARLLAAPLDELSDRSVLSTPTSPIVLSDLAPSAVRAPELRPTMPSKPDDNTREPPRTSDEPPATVPSPASNNPEAPLPSSTNPLELSELPLDPSELPPETNDTDEPDTGTQRASPTLASPLCTRTSHDTLVLLTPPPAPLDIITRSPNRLPAPTDTKVALAAWLLGEDLLTGKSASYSVVVPSSKLSAMHTTQSSSLYAIVCNDPWISESRADPKLSKLQICAAATL
jgi:hypothetical protein